MRSRASAVCRAKTRRERCFVIYVDQRFSARSMSKYAEKWTGESISFGACP